MTRKKKKKGKSNRNEERRDLRNVEKCRDRERISEPLTMKKRQRERERERGREKKWRKTGAGNEKWEEKQLQLRKETKATKAM